MAWDFAIDRKTGDMTGGYVTGQDEIVQRIQTRVFRHYREWFVNTDCGLPWYKGPSTLIPGELSHQTAILGTRNFRYADNWIRNEIAETTGVIRMLDFHTAFEASSRIYSIRSEIATQYGLPFLFSVDTAALLRGMTLEEAL